MVAATRVNAGWFSVIGKLPDAILVCDDNRQTLFANASAAALLECAEAELVGSPLDRIFPPDLQLLQADHKRLPHCIKTASNASRYVEVTTVRSILDGQHLVVLRDVTSDRASALASRRSQQLAELALQSANMGCWSWSIVDEQTFFNERFRQLFDVAPDVQSPDYQLFMARVHPEDLPTLHNLLSETFRSGSAYEAQYRVVGRDGSVRWLMDRGRVMFDDNGHRIGMSGVAWDITKEREQVLQQASQVRELARSNLDLQRFAHVASHDLKEPLRNMCALSDLLARQSGNKLDDDEREVLDMIVSSGRRMAVLIDSMLSYAKAGMKREVLKTRVPAAEIVREALANLTLLMQQKGAKIEIGELPVIEVSRSEITQVFQNLLANAAKYCTETPHIKVDAESKNGVWEFRVQDNGIGIERSHSNEIFEMFARFHTDAYDGTGAGLAICKRIIEKHNGRIWVESEVGKGSTFFFTLPV